MDLVNCISSVCSMEVKHLINCAANGNFPNYILEKNSFIDEDGNYHVTLVPLELDTESFMKLVADIINAVSNEYISIEDGEWEIKKTVYGHTTELVFDIDVLGFLNVYIISDNGDTISERHYKPSAPETKFFKELKHWIDTNIAND